MLEYNTQATGSWGINLGRPYRAAISLENTAENCPIRRAFRRKLSRSSRVGAKAKHANAIVNFGADFARRDLGLRVDRDR